MGKIFNFLLIVTILSSSTRVLAKPEFLSAIEKALPHAKAPKKLQCKICHSGTGFLNAFATDFATHVLSQPEPWDFTPSSNLILTKMVETT